MNSGKTIFAQLVDLAPSADEFRRCVERYHGNYKVKSFSCWDDFLTLAFAQLTYRESQVIDDAPVRRLEGNQFYRKLVARTGRITLSPAHDRGS